VALEPLHPAGDLDLARRLVALQRRSYAIEAELIGDDRIPLLGETVDQLQRAGLRWLGAVVAPDSPGGRCTPGADDAAARGVPAAGGLRADGSAAVGERVLAGAIAYTDEAGATDIHRLVVDPVWLRRGIGRTLVTAVLAGAAGRAATVSTGRDNPPARALYERLGFGWVADAEVLPGLWVAHYLRPADVSPADR